MGARLREVQIRIAECGLGVLAKDEMVLTCEQCGASFSRQPTEIKRRPSRYCSVPCSNKSRVRVPSGPGQRWCSKHKALLPIANFRPGKKASSTRTPTGC